MIICTIPSRRTRRTRRRRGFTLPEVIIGASLGTIVLAGVLSTFLMLGRNGVSAAGYSDMDAQARKALEEFAQDVRMASDVTWHSSRALTLTVVDNYAATGNQVTYAWDNDSTSDTYRCFYRIPGDGTAPNTKTIYIRNVTDFSFYRFNRLNAATASNAATKRIQIAMTIATSGATLVTSTNNVVSASFILRNKPVS